MEPATHREEGGGGVFVVKPLRWDRVHKSRINWVE